MELPVRKNGGGMSKRFLKKRDQTALDIAVFKIS
jgi:hypothetical protein